MNRAPSDSLDAKSWESNLANPIFKAISIIPGIFLSRLVVCCASGASPGGLRRYGAGSKEVSGVQRKPRAPEWWPESSTFGWPGFGHIKFLSSLVVCCASGASPGGSRRGRAASREVPRGHWKARAPGRWPESSGRSLDDDFQVEAFSCQVWACSVLLGRLQVPGLPFR